MILCLIMLPWLHICVVSTGGSFSEHFYCLIRNSTCKSKGIGSLGAREKQLSLLCLVCNNAVDYQSKQSRLHDCHNSYSRLSKGLENSHVKFRQLVNLDTFLEPFHFVAANKFFLISSLPL